MSFRQWKRNQADKADKPIPRNKKLLLAIKEQINKAPSHFNMDYWFYDPGNGHLDAGPIIDEIIAKQHTCGTGQACLAGYAVVLSPARQVRKIRRRILKSRGETSLDKIDESGVMIEMGATLLGTKEFGQDLFGLTHWPAPMHTGYLRNDNTRSSIQAAVIAQANDIIDILVADGDPWEVLEDKTVEDYGLVR